MVAGPVDVVVCEGDETGQELLENCQSAAGSAGARVRDEQRVSRGRSVPPGGLWAGSEVPRGRIEERVLHQRRWSGPGFGLMFDDQVVPDAQHARRLARLAEQAGFESLWYGERVTWGDDGGSGEASLGSSNPLILLAYLAGVTRRLTLATGVLRLPRDPVSLAREAAALDRLAPGRFVLGIGVGGVYEEVRRPGLLPDERARRTDEYVRAVRLAWEHQGGRPWPSAPGVPQAGRGEGFVPVTVGGWTETAARRAGRLGDGFFPLATSWEDLERLVGVMRRAAGKAGREPAAIPVACLGSPRFGEEDRARWQQLGVARVVFPLGGSSRAGWEDDLFELASRARELAAGGAIHQGSHSWDGRADGDPARACRPGASLAGYVNRTRGGARP